jgi:pyruvate dehydrogenase E2 component (dihydrolipoamide acetyltransferase)
VPIEILMPALSPTMTQGNLARWLKKEGDKVKPGDVLAEIETDKATMEVESIDEGILGKILIASGSANVAVNSLIALLLEEGENPETIANYAPKIAKPLEKNIVTNKVEMVAAKSPIENIGDRIKISPLAKRLANEKKLDLRKIIGTGPYGRIIRDDILNIKEH